MSRNVLAVTALLMLMPVSNAAAADEATEQRNKRAQKVLATLEMLGIAHPEIKNLVMEAQEHVEEDGYFYIADHKMEEGRVALRFEYRGVPKLRQLQLSYVPKDSNYSLTATTRGVMLRYHYEFK